MQKVLWLLRHKLRSKSNILLDPNISYNAKPYEGFVSLFTQKYFSQGEKKKRHLLKPIDGNIFHNNILVIFLYIYFHHFHRNITSRVWFFKVVFFFKRIINIATTHLTNVLKQHPYGHLSNGPHHPIQTLCKLAYPKLFCYLINKTQNPYLH